MISQRAWVARRPSWPQVRRSCRLRDAGNPDRRIGDADRRTENEPTPISERPTATVLVVDDDPAVRRMIARMLEGEEFVVVEAADGLEALDQCSRCPVAVVVTDVRMPRMGGLELGQRLAEAWPRIQLLFVTAYPDTDPSGVASRILTKPFNVEELVKVVRSLADRYRQEIDGGDEYGDREGG